MIYRAQHKDKYEVPSINKLYDKVLNLASDHKEYFNLDLHIIIIIFFWHLSTDKR